MDFTQLHEKVSSSMRGKFWLDLYPMTKLTIALCGSALAICMPGFLFGFLLTALLLVFAITCGKGKSYGRVMLSVLLIFVGLMVLARALFYDGGGPVLASFGGFSIYQEGMMVGLRSSSIIMGFSSSLVFFYITTEPEYLMLALEQRHCPPKATFVILSTFQMIPQMGTNAKIIQDAQRARGIETEGGLKTRAKAFLPMLMPLLLSSFSVAEEKSLALETRGFNYDAAKTRLRVVSDSPLQKTMRIVLVVLTVIACVAGGYFKWLA
jgi:energy-coupling factor transport system permease protein